MQKLLKQILLLSGPIIIGLGIFKFTIYYYFFNVPITKFLEITEVIVLFANDLVLYLLLTFISSVLAFSTFKSHKNIYYRRQTIVYYKSQSFIKRIVIYFKTNPSWPITISIFIILSFIQTILKREGAEIEVWLTVIFVLSLVIRLIILELKRKIWLISTLKKQFENYETIFYYFLSIAFFTAIYTCSEVRSVKYQYKYINTSFVTDERMFKSDSLHFYIGNTNKYIFLYNKDSNLTTIIPMNHINELSFGKINYIPKSKK